MFQDITQGSVGHHKTKNETRFFPKHFTWTIRKVDKLFGNAFLEVYNAGKHRINIDLNIFLLFNLFYVSLWSEI